MQCVGSGQQTVHAYQVLLRCTSVAITNEQDDNLKCSKACVTIQYTSCMPSHLDTHKWGRNSTSLLTTF
jgi:hypothetical protein